MSSIVARSAPEIFSPTGVRMPVVSMSMRALMGMVQAFETPGSFSAAFSSATSCLREMWSGVMWRKTAFSPLGRPGGVPGVARVRHCDCGFSVMTVSSIESGAGSVRRVGAAGLAEDAVHLGELL